MLMHDPGTFYPLLTSIIAGAEQKGLDRKQLATMLKPVVWPDSELYNTPQSAEYCNRSPFTL
jgi:hypothetical protein